MNPKTSPDDEQASEQASEKEAEGYQDMTCLHCQRVVTTFYGLCESCSDIIDKQAEQIKAKDWVLNLCENEDFSGQSILSPFLKRQIKQALKGGE